eukprot:CAMPEP_0185191310 /NCGR_PEP_ID=MMETSP1140-20130426/15431_1 /TAXON_ID=298111 /ORGANISM="Pavlova sp., Strain CCMP459" /LENGTH=89 /DNA_ID=CAMNT_0027758013 /DNA_START=118 /DNA_END=387 /DNA_ORIENTATION=+
MVPTRTNDHEGPTSHVPRSHPDCPLCPARKHTRSPAAAIANAMASRLLGTKHAGCGHGSKSRVLQASTSLAPVCPRGEQGPVWLWVAPA